MKNHAAKPASTLWKPILFVTDHRVLRFILSSVLTLILLAITTVIGWAMIRYSCVGAVGIPGWEVGLLFVVGFGMAILVGLGMARYANKTFGFVNGDILGATNEISRCAMLLTVLLVAGLIAVW